MKLISFIISLTSVWFLFVAQPASAQVLNRWRVPACLELKVGPWTPPLGRAAAFSTPPDTVHIWADSMSRPYSGWKRATPPIRHAYSRGRERALWTALDSTGLHIIWSDGFTGADMRLFRSHYGYFGVVRMLSDAIGPEATTPKATVVARSVECKDGLP
jgi:hypothetical protein